MRLSSFGPPLSDEERQRLTVLRYRNRYLAYGPEVLRRTIELIEKDATYLDLYEQLPFFDEEAARNFCYSNGLKAKVHRKHGRPKAIRAEVEQYINQGLLYREIADKLPQWFHSTQAVSDFARKYKLNKAKLRWRAHQQETVLRVWELRRAGYSMTQIASMMKMTPGQISGIAWGYALKDIRERPARFKRILGSYKSDTGLGRGRAIRSPTSVAAA